ncbi:MAG: hypothetical protein ACKVPJ_06430 [Chitinophagales bacterium]
MIASDSTFRLVKSLTKNEKRYFKLFASITAGEKNYMRIFNAMDRQKMYDEKAIKSKFKKTSLQKNFAQEKQYLQKMILRALRNFHDANEISNVSAFADLEMLTRKGISDVAGKLAAKYKQDALEQESFLDYFYFLRYESRVAGSMQQISYTENYLNNDYKKDLYNIEMLRYALVISMLKNDLIILAKKYQHTHRKLVQEKLTDIEKSLIPPKVYSKFGLKAKIAVLHIYTLYYNVSCEFETAYDNARKLYKMLFRKKLSPQEAGIVNYTLTLIMYIDCCIHTKRYKEGLEVCDLYFKTIHAKPYLHKHEIYSRHLKEYIESKMQILSLSGSYSECIEFYKNSAKLIVAIQGVGTGEFAVITNYALAVSYFGLQNYPQALDHLKIVLSYKKQKLYTFHIFPAQVIYLLCHIELGNDEFCMHYMRSVRWYFDTQGADILSFTEIMRILKEFINNRNLAKRNNAMKKSWFERIQQLLSIKEEEHFMRYSLFHNWVEMKVKS